MLDAKAVPRRIEAFFGPRQEIPGGPDAVVPGRHEEDRCLDRRERDLRALDRLRRCPVEPRPVSSVRFLPGSNSSRDGWG
jgi:hypothetical protein